MKVSLEQLSKVLALIHEAGAAPERWQEALAAIVSLVQGSRGALMDIDAASGALLTLGQVGHDPANAKVYAEHYYTIDPTRAVALTTPALNAATVYETFPKKVREAHEYFDFARRVDIGDVIGTSTPAAQGRRALVSLQRPVGARGYDAAEKQLFEILATHVALAKRMQWRLGEAWAEKAELEAALGRLALPAFVVDREGSIRHLNAAARTLLGRSAALGVRMGKLRFLDAKLGAAVHAAVRAAAAEGGRSTALALALGKETGEVLVAPLAPQHAIAAPWQVPLALVVVAAGPDDERAIAARLQQVYRLTPAESRIAAALAVGKTVQDVAHAMRVSDATLRTHLRSIFEKTGTRRQAELVRVALRGAVILPSA